MTERTTEERLQWLEKQVEDNFHHTWHYAEIGWLIAEIRRLQAAQLKPLPEGDELDDFVRDIIATVLTAENINAEFVAKIKGRISAFGTPAERAET